MTVRRNVLILGIGNSLLRDEGAGIHAMNCLREQLANRDDITFLDGGTLSFTLAGAIEETSHLIVLDAAQLDAAPGHSLVFEGAEMDAFIGSNRKCSVHEVSLLDLLAIAHLSGHLPPQRALIGIQPAEVDWGEHPLPCGRGGDAEDMPPSATVDRGMARMNLENITIKAETADPHSIGNITAILSEIASRLGALADGGETSLIDLKGLPLSSGEYEHLRFTLGRGEVSVNLDAIGMSEIVETQFSGVWWVTHYNDQGDIIADLIEIATIPNILLSQPEDMRTGLALLHAIISQPASSDD